MANYFQVADLKKSEIVEFEIDLEEKKIGENYCGHFKIKRKMKTVGRNRSFSKFQSTLGLKEEDWEAYIEVSNTLKLPISENSFEASISMNELGEETATFVWNTFQTSKNLVTGVIESSLQSEKYTECEDIRSEGEEVGPEMLSTSVGLPTEVEVVDSAALSTTGGEGEGSFALNIEGKELASAALSIAGEGKVPATLSTGEEGVKQPPVVAASSVTGQELVQFELPAARGEMVGLICSYCGASGIKDLFNMGRHISRMHRDSFVCNICRVEFSDRYTYNVHSTYCYHYCPIVGCSFKEKRKSRMDGHIRWHCRT